MSSCQSTDQKRHSIPDFLLKGSCLRLRCRIKLMRAILLSKCTIAFFFPRKPLFGSGLLFHVVGEASQTFCSYKRTMHASVLNVASFRFLWSSSYLHTVTDPINFLIQYYLSMFVAQLLRGNSFCRSSHSRQTRVPGLVFCMSS